MAIVPSTAKAQIAGGTPPFLNAQMTRGAVLKKTFVCQATNTIAANSVIQDIDLPEGCVIDLSSIALSHNGIGASNLQLGIAVTDKNGAIVGAPTVFATLSTTATAYEIVRSQTTNGNVPQGGLLLDPYTIIQDPNVPGINLEDRYILKERYHLCLTVANSAAINSTKMFTVIMDCIIP